MSILEGLEGQHPLAKHIAKARAWAKAQYKVDNPFVVINYDNLPWSPFVHKKNVDARWIYDVFSGPEPMVQPDDVESIIANNTSSAGGFLRQVALVDDSMWMTGQPDSWIGEHIVTFHGHEILVLGIIFGEEYNATQHVYVVVGPNETVVRSFISDMNDTSRNRLRALAPKYIFNDEHAVIHRPNKSWDDVTIEPQLRTELENNFAGFFKAKDFYAKYGLPYRRGIILIGPPGNGKSTVIKILASIYREYPFFLFGFGSRNDLLSGIRGIFRRAAALGPSVVVLEDIDRLAKEEIMREFLNLLDGISSPNGVMVVATSNNADKIDPALIERPSRFDVVLRFDVPTEALRARYIEARSKVMNVPLGEQDIKDLSKLTDKFSMAMLQEVFSGAALRAVNAKSDLTLDHLLESQKALAASLLTVKKERGESTGKTGFTSLLK